MNDSLVPNECLWYYKREDWHHIVQYKAISTKKRVWIQRSHKKLIKQINDIEEHEILDMLHNAVAYLKVNNETLKTT